MKHMLKKMVRKMVNTPAVWRVLDRTFLPPARYMDWIHEQSKSAGRDAAAQADRINREAIAHLRSSVILHGPFKGMAYTNDLFCCSAIPPKLLGSYEREIHPWLETMAATAYDGVVDVGCAEGYYAVGFAWRLKNAPVYAYDINEAARAQCRKLAEANGVAGRVDIRSFCDPAELARVVDGRRFLVIADCEGYEKDLFCRDNLHSLRRADILIEVHDFMDIAILPHLRNLFAETHVIREAESIDDLRKLDRYEYPELRGLSIQQRYNITAEWRQRIMVWMYLTPKSA